MNSFLAARLLAGAISLSIFLSAFALPQGPPDEPDKTVKTVENSTPGSELPETFEEARNRAKLLHETFRGVLQVMHRDFFDPGDRNRIPSASLQDVFDELSRSHGVEIRWIGVNAKTLNIDHEPKDDFEKKAVKALSSGKKDFEAIEGNRYRRMGTIVLHNACLKCHVPNRKSLEDRAAGLAISMSLKPKPAIEKKPAQEKKPLLEKN